MKILYLTPSHPDYLSDQLYSGLCRLLGWESVVDFPYKPYYHDAALPSHFVLKTPGRTYGLAEVLGLLRDNFFDLLVVSAIRREPLEVLETIWGKVALPAIVLLDGDDGRSLRHDMFRRYRMGLYFKREYALFGGSCAGEQFARWRWFGSDRALCERTFPLQFSVVLEAVPRSKNVNRDVDVSFVGLASHRLRLRAVELLREAKDLHFEGGVFAEPTTRKSKLTEGLLGILMAKLQGDPYASPEDCRGKQSVEEYFSLLHRSKIGLSIRGAGFDTMRYWETVACKTLLISERPWIHIPNNFEHGKHAVFCRPDLCDLVDQARTYVHNEELRRAIAEAGYHHLVKFHTCEKRAGQFLEICRKQL